MYPAANAWLAPLPNFTTVRDFHAAFIFRRPSDGHKLLCVAGGNGAGWGITSTQCYDFNTGTWGAENATVPPLPTDLTPVWSVLADRIHTPSTPSP